MVASTALLPTSVVASAVVLVLVSPPLIVVSLAQAVSDTTPKRAEAAITSERFICPFQSLVVGTV